MKPAFETYISQHDPNNRHFVVLTHAQGEGKFVVRKIKTEASKGARYSVTSSSLSSYKFQDFLEVVPDELDCVFSLGAINISFYEGEVTAEFPPEVGNSFEPQQLAEISQKSLQGMLKFCSKYGGVDQDPEDSEMISIVTPWLTGVFVVLGISVLSLVYGSRILPLNWIVLTVVCFLIQLPLIIVLKNFAENFVQIGKAFLFCLIGANSIFLVLLIGFVSLHLLGSQPYVKEGIVEHLFQSRRMNHLMRIRLADNRNTVYLLPRSLLKSEPEYLPRSAIFTMRDGLFGTRYIDAISLAY